jgi:hypothetical protein
MSTRVHIVLGPDLLERVDSARGLVSRGAWIRDAVRVALGEEPLTQRQVRSSVPREELESVPEPRVPLDSLPLAGDDHVYPAEKKAGKAKARKMIFKCPRPACTRSHLGPAVCSNHGVDMVATGQEI